MRFKLLDEQGLLLIDIKDLRAMLNYVGAHASELRNLYGNIAQQSIGYYLRRLPVSFRTTRWKSVLWRTSF